jgi:hypothetical protein
MFAQSTVGQNSPVYVSMTTVATGDEPAENARIVGEEMLGWLHGVEGFKGLMILYQEGKTLGLTFWESRELAERSLPLRMEFLGRMLTVANVEVERIEGFDVVLDRHAARRD